jgi:hypothetical protein
MSDSITAAARPAARIREGVWGSTYRVRQGADQGRVGAVRCIDLDGEPDGAGEAFAR